MSLSKIGLTDWECDYATGLSRLMAGRVLPSERPEHVIYESTQHPEACDDI